MMSSPHRRPWSGRPLDAHPGSSEEPLLWRRPRRSCSRSWRSTPCPSRTAWRTGSTSWPPPSRRIEEAARAALLDPSATQIALRSADEAQVVQLVYLSSGTGYLVDNNLEPLESDRTYQLWALHGDRAVSAGVLGGEPGVTAFTVAGTVDGFAVSVEEATGATQPTADPVVLGFLD